MRTARLLLLFLALLALAPHGADAYLIWMECDGLNVPDYVYGKDRAQAYDNYDTYVGSAADQCRIVLECAKPGWYGSAGNFMEGYSCGFSTREEAAERAIQECRKVGGEDCAGGHGWTACDDGSSHIVPPGATMVPTKQKMFFSEGKSGGICGTPPPPAPAAPPVSETPTIDHATVLEPEAAPQMSLTLAHQFLMDCADNLSRGSRFQQIEIKDCTLSVTVSKNGGASMTLVKKIRLSEVMRVLNAGKKGSTTSNAGMTVKGVDTLRPDGSSSYAENDMGVGFSFFVREGTGEAYLREALSTVVKHCGGRP